jgi:hypothetical protein
MISQSGSARTPRALAGESARLMMQGGRFSAEEHFLLYANRRVTQWATGSNKATTCAVPSC